MAFVRTPLFETEDQERARLALSHPHSKSGMLAPLPVTVRHLDTGMLIELPQLRHADEDDADTEDRRIIVALVTFRSGATPREPGEPRRRDGSWHAMVVASTHPSYPVGGFDLSIGEAELRRGRLVEASALLAL